MMVKNKIKNMTKGVNWIPFIFCLGIVLELLLALIGKGSGLGGASNVLVMVSFFVVAGGIYFLSYRYLSEGMKIKESLKDTKVEIRTMATQDENKDVLERLTQKDEVFKDKNLNDAFKVFKEEIEDIEKVGNVDIETKVDIGDYVNEDLVDSVIHASFLNQISSTLTGLGILGTFLGLSISLNSFDLTGSAADVEANIGPLMDGIKVAFHTSICGLCFSIMYNFFYHKTRSSIMKELDDFLEVFQKNVVPSTENGSANTFLKYQALICKKLERQIELEDGIIKKQDDKFLGLAEQMKEQNENTLAIYEGISQKISESQTEGVERIVDSFIKQMNKSLESSFKEIHTMVQDIHKHEEGLMAGMSEGLDKIHGMSDNMAEINSGLENSLKQIEKFMGDTAKMQNLLSDNLAATKKSQELEMENQKVLVEHQTGIVTKLEALEKKIGESVEAQSKKMTDIFSKQEQQIRKDSEAFDASMKQQITDVGKVAQSELKKVSGIIDKMNENERTHLNAIKSNIEQFEESTKIYMKETGDNILLLNQNIESGVQLINKSVGALDGRIGALSELTDNVRSEMMAYKKERTAENVKEDKKENLVKEKRGR